MSEPNSFELLAENLSAFIRNLLERFPGSFLSGKAFGGATWGDIIAALILLGIGALVVTAIGGWARWFRKKNEERKLVHGWPHQIVLAFSKPVHTLIWLVVAYTAITPVLIRAQSPENIEATREAANKFFDFGIFAIVVWIFYRLTDVLKARLQVWAKRSAGVLDDLLIPPVIKTLRVLLPLVAVILGLPILGLPSAYDSAISQITSLILIAVVAWILFQAVSLAENFVIAKYRVDAADNLEARKIHTQVKVLSKTAYFVIILFTIASMLMVFEEVRRFGTNILASAGVVGIILGFAAQRTIANLFAGFQIAMAQPIRLDDVVVVEGEWGRIEEITLTYVVVRIWDERRLILPISYFIEKPFQNWTRTSSQILGSVFFYTDYSVPLAEVRNEVKRIVEGHPDWDKRFWNVQVTDTTDRSMQVRVLATASDSGKAFNLRCDIREKVLDYLQKNHAGSLPKMRAEIRDGIEIKPLEPFGVPPVPARAA